MGCTKTQLLALLMRIERDLENVCQRELDIESEKCDRILTPVRIIRQRLEELTSEEILYELFR